MSNLKNPFGLVNGELKHIKNIEKGAEVLCPECGERLIVKDGEFNVKHLAHKLNNDEECSTESVIHKYIKIYLYKELKQMKVLNTRVVATGTKFMLSDSELINIRDREIEYRGLGKNYIPDIFFRLDDNSRIALEICYRSPKDKRHLQKILPTLSIDQVYELNVYEGDLIDLDIDLLINRAKLIYNKIEKAFEATKVKVLNIHSENKSLKMRIGVLQHQIDRLNSRLDGTYISEIEEAIRKERLLFREEANTLKREYRKLEKAIEYWSHKVLSTNTNISEKDLATAELKLKELRKYYYDLESELYKAKELPQNLKQFVK